MEYKEHIQRAIDYIERNLISDIDLSDLAKVSGYSVYHFLRIFKEATKLTPADYIRKRRLTEIVKHMSERNNCISEIAFGYGFNSKENFIRAFKAEHHVLPTEYKTAKSSLKLYDKFSFEIEPFTISPEVKELEAFSLTAIPCDEPFVPNFWNKYNCKKISLKLTGGKECIDYGVSIFNEKLDYYIGVQSELANGNITDTIKLYIPSGLYAIFETPQATHFNFVNTIHRTWEYIACEWLPESGYTRRLAPAFETYIENSRSFKEKIYIPILKRSD